MFPYLIAGAIGFAVAKIFENETPKFADGGDVSELNNYLRNIRLDEYYMENEIMDDDDDIKQFKADFGRKGNIVFRIYPDKEGNVNNSIYISSIGRGTLDYGIVQGIEGKKDSRGEGAKAIASLFLLYPNVNSIHYEDESYFENEDKSFWKKIGGDSSELFRNDFFNYYQNKFGYNPDIRYAGGGIVVTDYQNENFIDGKIFKKDSGVLIVGKYNAKRPYGVVKLFVDENDRRKGIATDLIQYAEKHFQQGFMAQVSNLNSLKLHYKLGFRSFDDNLKEEDYETSLNQLNQNTSVGMASPNLLNNLQSYFNYADGGSVLLAPNGKPSNLTPEQYKLVRTPAFIQWFGDWQNNPENSSKVVDENGEPLVVYHGTDSKFNIFDKKYIGSKTYLTSLNGFHFAKDKNIANRYGIKIKSFFIGKGKLLFNGGKMVVTDNPNQIKLADGTNTTFDGNNPDIRFDDGGSVSNYREFYDNLQVEDGSKYIGQKFGEVFPFISRTKTPNDYRIILKQYYGILKRLEEDNYSTKAMKQTDLNKLKSYKINIDKKKYLAGFYLDSKGIITKFVK